ETTPSWEKMTATITVPKSSKKPSTHRWIIQNRQVSTTDSGSVIQGMLRPWSGCQGRCIERGLESADTKGRPTPQTYLQAQKVTPIGAPKLVSPWLCAARSAFDKWSSMTDRLTRRVS